MSYSMIYNYDVDGLCGPPNVTPLKPSQIDEYRIGHTLGEGRYGVVASCYSVATNQEYAVKIMLKCRLHSPLAMKQVRSEIEVMSSVQSSYITRLYEVIETNDSIYVIMDKGGPDLFTFLDEYPNGLPELWTLDIMWHILQAVKCLHDNNICHRDLKPENILINFDEKSGKVIDLKMCDFGVSARLNNHRLAGFYGSPGFVAPEIICCKSYDTQVDIWSLGCIAIELVLGHGQFRQQWVPCYEDSIIFHKNKDIFPSKAMNTLNCILMSMTCSLPFKYMISTCMSMIPEKRWNINNLIYYPIFSGRSFTSIYRDCKQYQPRRNFFDNYSNKDISMNLETERPFPVRKLPLLLNTKTDSCS